MVTIVGTTGDVRTRRVAGAGAGTVRVFRGGREVSRGTGGGQQVPTTQPTPVNIVDGQEVPFTPDPSQYTQVGETPTGGGIFITREAAQPTPIESTQDIIPRQEAAIRQQQLEQEQGFTGRVEESFQGRPEAERFFVRGREVAVQRPGEETFEPGLTEGERARLRFEREGITREVEVTPQQLAIREQQFTPSTSSAEDLLFGGGQEPTPIATSQKGGVLVAVEGGVREATFTERLGFKVQQSEIFGETKLPIT